MSDTPINKFGAPITVSSTEPKFDPTLDHQAVSDTPRTDAWSYDAIKNCNSALLANDVQEVIPAEKGRELERENAELLALLRQVYNAGDNDGVWVNNWQTIRRNIYEVIKAKP